MADDRELIEKYVREKSEESFSILVNRHLALVHSAALRQVRSPELAEEVAQCVFTDLARQARQLKPDTILTAWLYQVTRRTAIDVVRREARRQIRERIASEMNAMNATADDWTQIEPLLDEAMHALDDTDRAAVLLRFFENKSLREVGQAIGASEDAAQKRVSRAVERLREFFSRRGVAIGAGALVAVLTANAVQAAPAGLALAVTSTALAGAAIVTSTTAAAATTITKTIAMTTLQKAVIALTLAAAVGTGIYEARQASRLQTRVVNLQEQQAPLAEQIRQLQQERDDAVRRLAGLRDENKRLARDAEDLLRLRSQVTHTQVDSQELARLKALEGELATNALSFEAQILQAKANKLKQRLEQSPNLKIPEIQLMSDKDWLAFVKGIKLDSDADYPEALGRLREYAKNLFAPMMGHALRAYARANDDQTPSEISQLQPYFEPAVDPAILARYQLTQSGELDWDKPAVAEKAAVDTNNDSLFQIGAKGSSWNYPAIGSSGGTAWGTNEFQAPPPPPVEASAPADPVETAAFALWQPAYKSYMADHGGQEPGLEQIPDVVAYLKGDDKAKLLGLINQLEKTAAADDVADLEPIRKALQK